MNPRFPAYLLVIALELSITACGTSSDSTAQNSPSATPSSAQAEASATAPTASNSGTASTGSNSSSSGGSAGTAGSGASSGSYTVGGTTSGLLGTGLILQLNSSSSLPVQANGTFSFPTSLASGTQYSVTVATQPASPTQTCVLANAVGTTGNAAVSNVLITCTLSPARFAYLGTHQGIYCYAIDAVSGGLVALATPECDTGILTGVAADPVAPFVYAASAGVTNPATNLAPAGTVRAYQIDQSTGRLVRLNGPDAPAGQEPLSVAVDPKGRFVYAGNYGYGTSMAGSNGLGSVSAYTINATTGALTPVPGSPFATGYGLNWLIIHPSGKYLYAVNEGSNNVSGFAIDQISGGLTPVLGSPFPTPPSIYNTENPTGMALDPAGRFLFVSSSNTPDLFAFTIDPNTGTLSAVAGSPFSLGCVSFLAQTTIPPTGCSPGGLAVDPSGAFLYVTGGYANAVYGLSIDPNTGALALLPDSPVATTPYPNFITTNGAVLYVTNNASPLSVSIFSLNSATGGLAPISGSPVAAWPDPSAGAYNLAIAP
jgi:6-phosphogluconolactonase